MPALSRTRWHGPAPSEDFWLSSGSGHFWNLPGPNGPGLPATWEASTPWEARIDMLMAQQASTIDPAKRSEIFNEVQQVFAENLPVIYFVAPRIYYAHNARVLGVVPSVQRPPALWNADMLAVRH